MTEYDKSITEKIKSATSIIANTDAFIQRDIINAEKMLQPLAAIKLMFEFHGLRTNTYQDYVCIEIQLPKTGDWVRLISTQDIKLRAAYHKKLPEFINYCLTELEQLAKRVSNGS